MGQRLDFQAILETLLTTDKVYFQPPANVQMIYPCIVYKRDDIDLRFADNKPYTAVVKYLVTVIDRNPDSTIPPKVAQLPQSSFIRNYAVEDLNHDVFTIYF